MAQKVKVQNQKPKKKANGYNQMTIPVPVGEKLKDLGKRGWVIGPSIGRGGFGVIYSAKAEDEKSKDYPYIVKFEPMENGPLFVERHFYLKAAAKTDIDNWIKGHKLEYLGLPRYWGSGSHEMKGEKYRFLVTDRFGTDLWTKFTENNKKFPLTTVLRIALQTLDVLEYLHTANYIHGDVKAGNLVLGREKKTENKVFLIDYGLVSRPTTDATYKPDPKKAHDGTLEYLSIDAHKGVPTMRGDLEVLAYNMLHWLTSSLPWMDLALSNTKKKEVEVEAQKTKFMDNISSSLAKMPLNESEKTLLKQLFNYLKSVEHNKAPKYEEVRKMLKSALKTAGGSDTGPLIFTAEKAKTPRKNATTSRGKASKRASTESSEDEEELEVSKPKSAKPRQLNGAAKTKPRAKASKVQLSEDSDDEKDNSSPTPAKKTKPTGKGSRSKSAVAPAEPLWKQSLTAQVSGVERPGEYTRQTPNPKTKKTTVKSK